MQQKTTIEESSSHTQNGVIEEAFEKGYSFFASNRSFFRKASSFLARKLVIKSFALNATQPLVTFAFDDIPVSAYEIAAPLLEKQGYKGTFYIATALCSTYTSGSLKANLVQIKDLATRNHEIALHTHEHLPIFAYNKAALEQDLKINHSLIEALTPSVTRNFAAPYGALSIFHKFALRGKIRSIRSILTGINRGKIDPFCLKIINIDDNIMKDEEIFALLKQAQAQNGWVIFMSHNVGEQQKHITTSVERLKKLLEYTQNAHFKNVTIEEALDLIAVPPAQKEFSHA